MKDIIWFKNNFEFYLMNYEIEYKFYKNGDFGDLNQVEFNSKDKGGEIDFWSSGSLNIHFVNYITGQVLINVFLEYFQKKEIDEIFNRLKELI